MKALRRDIVLNAIFSVVVTVGGLAIADAFGANDGARLIVILTGTVIGALALVRTISRHPEL
jgi:hypothetical protein